MREKKKGFPSSANQAPELDVTGLSDADAGELARTKASELGRKIDVTRGGKTVRVTPGETGKNVVDRLNGKDGE